MPLSDNNDDRTERMKRVRVGLTGLAVVLLIVLLATALLTRVNQQAGPATVSAEITKDEPLSDLGVVPRAPDNGAGDAPAPGTTVPKR